MRKGCDLRREIDLRSDTSGTVGGRHTATVRTRSLAVAVGTLKTSESDGTGIVDGTIVGPQERIASEHTEALQTSHYHPRGRRREWKDDIPLEKP